jgi:hypothetical protein
MVMPYFASAYSFVRTPTLIIAELGLVINVTTQMLNKAAAMRDADVMSFSIPTLEVLNSDSLRV